MEDFAPLLVLAFMVISAVGRLLGKSRPAPPPRRRPRPTAPPPRPRSEGEGAGAAPRPAPAPVDEEHAPSADVLIPDDLWAILTGERRPPVAAPPAPEPAPASEPARAELRGDLARQVEVEEAEALAAEARERELSALVRRPMESDAPEAVSEEDEARHEAFHRRLEATTPAAALQVATGRRPLGARQRQLRRAVVLREVLGPPRGLEDLG